MDALSARNEAKLAASQSQAVLLNAEDATDGCGGAASPRSDAAAETDVEAGRSGASPIVDAVSMGSPGSTSRCAPTPMVATRQPGSPRPGGSQEGDCTPREQEKDAAAAAAADATATREQPDIMQFLENDPHNFALKKMGAFGLAGSLSSVSVHFSPKIFRFLF